MAIGISTPAQNAAADAIADLVDADSPTAGTLSIYDGTRPADVNTAVSGQTQLAEFTLSDPAFGAAASGVVTLAGTPIATTADADGTATWGRIFDGSGDAIVDGDVATSGGDITVNTTAFTTGVDVTLTSGTLTMPAGG